MRDINQIIRDVTQQIPRIVFHQYRPKHPADDDGIWWFSPPGHPRNIQIESWNGQCPFIVETAEQSSYAARTAHTVAEATSMIVAYLTLR